MCQRQFSSCLPQLRGCTRGEANAHGYEPQCRGVRDTARVLRISTDTVVSELRKKEATLESVNTALLCSVLQDTIAVDIQRAGEVEMDEMWSFVGKKGNQLAVACD